MRIGLRRSARAPRGVAPWSAFLRDQSGPQGEAHQSWDVENVQACHQLCAMVFDGFVADVQDRSDGLGGLAFGQQLQDLALTRGQLFERAVRAGDLLQGELFEELKAIVWCGIVHSFFPFFAVWFCNRCRTGLVPHPPVPLGIGTFRRAQ
jgi:hypothetical protein